MQTSVHRGGDRAVTTTDWSQSRHSFSFGAHYEPDNTHFGLLLAHNEDRLVPGPGFTTHPHRDLEIVSWVVSGSLEHTDSLGNHGTISIGEVQCLSAGTGVEHAERSALADEGVHHVQMWLPSDASGPPSYASADVAAALANGGLVPVASGRVDAALRIRQAGATLFVARVPVGGSVELPTAPHVHVFVTRGSATIDAVTLAAGDALRITDCDGGRITASEPAELLVWQLFGSVAVKDAYAG